MRGQRNPRPVIPLALTRLIHLEENHRVAIPRNSALFGRPGAPARDHAGPGRPGPQQRGNLPRLGPSVAALRAVPQGPQGRRQARLPVYRDRARSAGRSSSASRSAPSCTPWPPRPRRCWTTPGRRSNSPAATAILPFCAITTQLIVTLPFPPLRKGRDLSPARSSVTETGPSGSVCWLPPRTKGDTSCLTLHLPL